jgi:hypothetical protein
MHRSGTSAIAGTLAKLGPVAPKTLLGANAGNPRGHWESLILLQLHEDLLTSAGTSWSDWRQFDPKWYGSAKAREFKRRAKTLLLDEFGKTDAFVMKDPRICRFVRFWLEIFDAERITPRPILPIRHPLEVAQSLATRDNSSISQGLLLWLRHAIDAERSTRHLPRVILAWDDFLKDWRSQIDRIAAQFDLPWREINESTAEQVDEFLTSELKREHIDSGTASMHPDMHEWVIDAYDALLELTRDPVSLVAQTRLDDIAAKFAESSRLFGRALASGNLERDQLKLELAEARQNEAQQAQAAHDERVLRIELTDDYAQQISRTHASRQGLVEQHARELAELDRRMCEIQALRDEALAREAESVERERIQAIETTSIKAEASTAQQIVEQQLLKISQLEELASEQKILLANALSNLDFLRGKFDRLRNQPIRSTYRWLTGRGI